MIYEIRTYTLRPGTVAEFEERYAKRLPLREKHSKLGAFWHTEFGPPRTEDLFRFMPAKTACCIGTWRSLFRTPASARLEECGE